MKRVLSLVSGMAIIILSIFFIEDDLRNYEVQKKGKIVEMVIVDLPGSCIGTKSKYFMKVKFEGRLYIKQIGGLFCEEHTIGDVIKMKFLKGKDKVLHPEESVVMEFISAAFLILFGFYIIYYGTRHC